jgi:hypothetical protein
MITVRQIERTWSAKQYERLLRDLLAARPEGGFQLRLESGCAASAAAIAVIRLDELSQAHVPVCSQLIRTILANQQADGGWGDPAVTALCLRALLCCNGQGAAIERGMQALAALQKTEGIWPREPLRRMPADALVSAFILFELGDNVLFRQSLRFDQAVAWFTANEGLLDGESRRLWERAHVRCSSIARGIPVRAHAEPSEACHA